MKIFEKYDVSEVKVKDPSLKRYINLKEMIVAKTHGRNREKFGKGKINIIERLVNLLCVPGHRGKKHRIITKQATGKYLKNLKVVMKALDIIEKETNQNPIQVLIIAIENAAPRDEITTIEYGGARYPQAVDTSPLRRLNLALKNIVHGAQDKSFRKKNKLSKALALEILAAYNNSNESNAISKKIELEKQADAAR